MKCPQCSFVCSELRDICPKCLLDLRPHKHSLGLPVTDSDASYKELVRLITKQPKAPETKRSGLFSKVLTSSSQKQERPSHSTATEKQPQLRESPPKRSQPTETTKDKPQGLFLSDSKIEEIQTEVNKFKPEERIPLDFNDSPESASTRDNKSEINLPLDNQDDSQASYFDESLKITTLKDDTPLPQTPDEPKTLPSKELTYLGEFEQPGSFFDETESRKQDNPLELPAYQKKKRYTSIDTTTGKTSKIRRKHTDVIETSYEFSQTVSNQPEPTQYVQFKKNLIKKTKAVEDLDEITEDDFTIPEMVSKPPPTTYPVPKEEEKPLGNEESSRQETLEINKQEVPLDPTAHIQMLFQETDEELQSLDELGEISLSFEQLAQRERSELVELYFDLAEDAIVAPGSERSFENQRIASATANFSSELTQKAVEVEKEIASIRRDKARAARLEERRSTMTRKRLAKEVPAEPIGWIRRAVCSVVDIITVSLFCFLTVFVSHLVSSPAFAFTIKTMQMPDTIDIIYIGGLFLAFLPLTLVFYQAIMLSLFERTIGMFLLKIEIAQEDGDLPSASQLLLRAFSFPLTTLFLGFIPPLFGKRSLADHLARTILIRQRELI
jgi:uncharacterized RDD family membrane protein YckC